MTNDEIKKILIEKGIQNLYHANTVRTSQTFIEKKTLLSRGIIRDKGFIQTPQRSDTSDQEFDVFYDIFFDSVDIHQRGKNSNLYGPVMFVFSIDLIDSIPPNSIKITKSNPWYWQKTDTNEERYFLTPNDLEHNFFRGNFQQHITIRHQKFPISFEYLEKIVIDNPQLENHSEPQKAYDFLSDLLKKNEIFVPLEIRKCDSGCKCHNRYRNYSKQYFHELFYFQ